MEGHMGLRELFVTVLLIAGMTAAVFLITENQVPNMAAGSSKAAIDRVVESPATLGDMLDQGMARADTRFYERDPEGTYDIETYRWAFPSSDSAPDAEAIKTNDLEVASVRFNDRYDDSLRAFAYRTFQRANLTGPPLIIGTAVFIADSNLVEGFRNSGEAFDVRYDPHPRRSQVLEDCSIIYNSRMETPAGTPVVIYDVACRIAYGANP